jgi:hypothetical protein
MKSFVSVLTLCFFLFSLGGIRGQISVKDSSVFAPLFIVSGGIQFPIGDWSKNYRFGVPIGGDILFKLKNNVLIGGSGHYLFGESTNDPTLLTNILPIISGDGSFPALSVGFRAILLRATFGGILPLFKRHNPNSGLLLLGGIGYGEHRTQIDFSGGLTPQLSTAYLRGYDRLHVGWVFSQCLGFMHLSNNKRINFYAGLELTQFYAQSARGWQYDTGPESTDFNTQWMIGLRGGWIFPAYKRTKYSYIEFKN